MELDGGNLDDDNIEREWWQLTIITSLPIFGEDDGKKLLSDSIKVIFKNFVEKHWDIKKHFVDKPAKDLDALADEKIAQLMAKSTTEFIMAEIGASGKSDDLTKDEVLKLKEGISNVLKEIPHQAMNQMIKNWHCFRLEQSGQWLMLGDGKCIVDSSLMELVPNLETNIQGGRVTKNLEKIEIFVANSELYLDGACKDKGKHEVELVLSYNLELTLRLGKALLVDHKLEFKKLLRNLEETMFYKLPSLDKVTLSEQHKQNLETNDGHLVVRNLVTDQDEWVKVEGGFVRSKIFDIPL